MGIVHRDLKPENVMIVSPMPGEKQRMEAAEIRALDVIMQRCLAKDNGDRYGSERNWRTIWFPLWRVAGTLVELTI
jgi:hypothetical protein